MKKAGGCRRGRCRRAAIVTCRLPASVISVAPRCGRNVPAAARSIVKKPTSAATAASACAIPWRSPDPAPETSRASQVEDETAMGAVPPPAAPKRGNDRAVRAHGATPRGSPASATNRSVHWDRDRRHRRRCPRAPPCWPMKSSGSGSSAREASAGFSGCRPAAAGCRGPANGAAPQRAPPRRVASRDPFVAQITPPTRTDTPDATGPSRSEQRLVASAVAGEATGRHARPSPGSAVS